MKKITILDNFPIILTKDSNYLSLLKTQPKSGDVILLPDDAIIVIVPTTMQSNNSNDKRV